MKIQIKKRGEMDYYLIMSLILGILLISIIFFWVFQEYFTEDDLTREQCKQSIFTRHNLPNYDIGTGGTLSAQLVSFKDDFPLKCKTEVIEIDYENTSRASKVISDAIAGCWALFDKGDASIFPAGTFFPKTTCFTCARIHFDKDVKGYYVGDKSPIIKPNLVAGETSILYEKMQNGESYYEYLTSSNKNKFLENYMSGTKTRENFAIEQEPFSFNNILDSLFTTKATIYYPSKVDSTKGDFHVVFSSWTTPKQVPINNLFFFQNAEDSLKQLSNEVIHDTWKWGNEITAACQYWDGINV